MAQWFLWDNRRSVLRFFGFLPGGEEQGEVGRSAHPFDPLLRLIWRGSR